MNETLNYQSNEIAPPTQRHLADGQIICGILMFLATAFGMGAAFKIYDLNQISFLIACIAAAGVFSLSLTAVIAIRVRKQYGAFLATYLIIWGTAGLAFIALQTFLLCAPRFY